MSDNSGMSFKELGLHPDILRAVVDAGYEIPTPIQEQAIPQVMAGHDVMGAAQTGTGKTAAFTLPILHLLMPHASASVSPARHPVRALMLAPTRELADQIFQNVHQYATHTPLRSAVVFGGVDMNPQTAQLRAGVELLIATPGRLLDHVQQKTVNLSQVSILVLDEADRMLDMGFLPDLQRIVNLLPKTRQSLLFSATFSPEIRKLGNTFLKANPVSIEVARRNATADNVTQEVFRLDRIEAKRAAVVQLVKDRGLKQVLVFTNTKIGAGRLARELIREGIAADAIHGDKTQGDRLSTLERFKRGEIEVLVATDVAARGLDIAELPAVINFDVPRAAEDYVHRIGRTGRAGASGQAISLMTADDERSVADIEALVGKTFIRGSLVLPASTRHDPDAKRGEGRTRLEGRTRSEGQTRLESQTRSEGHTRSERPDRYVPVRPAAPKPPSDPLFSQPYVETAPDPAMPKAAVGPGQPAGRGLGILGISRKPADIPALLGGARKPLETS